MARPFIFDIDILNNSASVSFQNGEAHGFGFRRAKGQTTCKEMQRVESWFSDSLAVKRK